MKQGKLEKVKATNLCEGCWFTNEHILCPRDSDSCLVCFKKIWVLKPVKEKSDEQSVSEF